MKKIVNYNLTINDFLQSAQNYLANDIKINPPMRDVWDARTELCNELRKICVNPEMFYKNLGFMSWYSGYKDAFADLGLHSVFGQIANYALLYYKGKYEGVDTSIQDKEFLLAIKRWYVAITPIGNGKLRALLKPAYKYANIKNR